MTALSGDSDYHQYIPFGCLVYPKRLREQSSFWRRSAQLRDSEWIRVEILPSVDDDDYEITRIYLLPDDTDNTRIDRSNERLQEDKRVLLSSLDFSPTTWNGSTKSLLHRNSDSPMLSASAQQLIADDNADHGSLLDLFNSIPAPNPDVRAIKEPVPRAVMSDILAGTIDGVVTQMYPYQCRSAAMMYQKEVQTTQFFDPRLLEVIDQKGGTYYYDPVKRSAFQQPRYYESVKGGILAEDMGAGKTLICLALIAATRHQPAQRPDLYPASNTKTVRPRVGSLMDMAAAAATTQEGPKKRHLNPLQPRCIEAVRRHPGWFYRPRPERIRASRHPEPNGPPDKIYLSHTTLVLVPDNLVIQWLGEIAKHTEGLKVLPLDRRFNDTNIDEAQALLRYDIVLCSLSYVEKIFMQHRQTEQDGSVSLQHPLGQVHFKRCIMDEGHKLGNVGLTGFKTRLLSFLDTLSMEARWIATGTPSTGMFGIEEGGEKNTGTSVSKMTFPQERRDLERIGSIASGYLKARPWSISRGGDGSRETRPAWRVYVMLPRHYRHSRGRKGVLRFVLNSLIIRHPLSQVSHLLPAVDTKFVMLEGSYQDKLALNIFSMMIIFNAVQSERTDQDYFFHPKNRASLLQLFTNLCQSAFFGGAYFPAEEIAKAVRTAEEFIQKKKEEDKEGETSISKQDMELLTAAIAFGKVAEANRLKDLAWLFHEVPLYVKISPSELSEQWSLDKLEHGNLVCTTYKFLREVQVPRLRDQGTGGGSWKSESYSDTFGRREGGLAKLHRKRPLASDKPLAGNTTPGERDNPLGSRDVPQVSDGQGYSNGGSWASNADRLAWLNNTQLVSTTSAKLSYLLDAILTHQKDEQILIFYEHNNIAWYLAGLLELLKVGHLIYARGISAGQRAEFVDLFNNCGERYRVLLMDLTQAAFGLDMYSASRVYFIGPVLNPQVEAQAVGRVRRLCSVRRRVTVEVLVLKDSVEEVIVERRRRMSMAEVQRCKSMLDDQGIYEWIRHPKIIPLGGADGEGLAQTAELRVPQWLFRTEKERDRDDLEQDANDSAVNRNGEGSSSSGGDVGNDQKEKKKKKRARFVDDDDDNDDEQEKATEAPTTSKRVRFAD